MTWAPDSAAVISLPRRLDRRALLPTFEPALGFPVGIVDAIDGAGLVCPAGWYSSLQALGNLRSHLSVLEHADGTIMLLEDDAVIPNNFQHRMQRFLADVPEHWEALMLGGEHELPPEPVSPGVVRCVATIRTHAYVLRPGVIADVIAVAKRAVRHWDYSLSELLGQRGRTYAPDPFLIETNGSRSDIHDSRPIKRASVSISTLKETAS